MRSSRTSSGIAVAGLLLAALSAAPAHAAALSPPPGYGCEVTYASADWATGFTALLTISNTGSKPFSPWILQFLFSGNQKITVGWSATWTQTPPSVQAVNPTWAKSIDPGASTSLGFQGTYSGINDKPTDFTLNGVPCKVTYTDIS
ncbi:cellulose binding domain-containing protein [Microbispora sp. NPDC088329]|uniref:cellulose binding domain-containing protein n=1 Tax=Microbispora sp. NPDC088329 TaxID=3154869 RepID=UPI0034398102